MAAGDRARRMRRGSIAGVLSRGVSVACGLVSVPLLLNYLGATRFGIWATVTSLTALLSFADLGLSNGLVNEIADGDARGDRRRMRTAVSSAVVLLSGLAVLILVLVIGVGSFVDLGRVVSAQRVNQAGGAVQAFAICFALGVPLGCVLRIQMGLQEGQSSYMWMAIGNVFGVLGNIAVVVFGGSLILAVLSTGLGPVVAAGANALILFGRQRPWLRPRLSLARREVMRSLLRSGGQFFVIQASFAICYQSDALVISHVLGPRAVTVYTVPMKLFYFAPVVQNFALLPMWPAVRNAIAEQDFDWAKRAFRRVLLVGCGVVGLVTAVLLVFAPFIIRIWTGDKVIAPTLLLVTLALWAMTSSLLTPISYFLSGAGSAGFLAKCFAVMAPMNLLLSIVGARVYGVAGVPAASAAADVCCVLIPSAFYLRRLPVRLLNGDVGRPRGAGLRRRVAAAVEGESLVLVALAVVVSLCAGVLVTKDPKVLAASAIVPWFILVRFRPAAIVSVIVTGCAVYLGVYLRYRINLGGNPISVLDVFALTLPVLALSMRRQTDSIRLSRPGLTISSLFLLGLVSGALLGLASGASGHSLIQVLRVEFELWLALVAALVAGGVLQWQRALIKGFIAAAWLAAGLQIVSFVYQAAFHHPLWSAFPFGASNVANLSSDLPAQDVASTRDNYLATFSMLPGLALVLYRLRPRDVLLLSAVLVSVAVSLSRALWLAAAVTIVIVLLARVATGRRLRASSALGFVAAVSIAALALTGLASGVLGDRLSGSLGSGDSSFVKRQSESDEAFARLGASPQTIFAGLGAGAFIPAIHQTQDSAILEDQLLATWTNFGLIAVVGTVGLLLLGGAQAFVSLRRRPDIDPDLLAMGLSLPSILFVSAFSGTLLELNVSIPFWVLAGSIFAATVVRRPQVRRGIAPPGGGDVACAMGHTSRVPGRAKGLPARRPVTAAQGWKRA